MRKAVVFLVVVTLFFQEQGGDYCFGVNFTSADTKYSVPATHCKDCCVVIIIYTLSRVCYYKNMKSGANIVATSKIRHLRESNGISQETAAETIGVSRPFYSLLEQGKREPTVGQLYKLASMLSVDLSEITTGIDAKTSFIDYKKFKDLIMACIKFGADGDGKITKTKLAKLVYFSDFAWYFHNGKSMTNAMYRRIPKGPVADDYFRAIDELYEEQAIAIEPKGQALMISAVETVNSKLISSEENSLIQKICNKWQGHSTDEIVEFTHGQSPWKNTTAGTMIPYELILSEPSDNLF